MTSADKTGEGTLRSFFAGALRQATAGTLPPTKRESAGKKPPVGEYRQAAHGWLVRRNAMEGRDALDFSRMMEWMLMQEEIGDLLRAPDGKVYESDLLREIRDLFRTDEERKPRMVSRQIVEDGPSVTAKPRRRQPAKLRKG